MSANDKAQEPSAIETPAIDLLEVESDQNDTNEDGIIIINNIIITL